MHVLSQNYVFNLCMRTFVYTVALQTHTHTNVHTRIHTPLPHRGSLQQKFMSACVCLVPGTLKVPVTHCISKTENNKSTHPADNSLE